MILFTVTTKQDRWSVLWTCEDSKVKEKGLQGQKRKDSMLKKRDTSLPSLLPERLSIYFWTMGVGGGPLSVQGMTDSRHG